MNYQLKCMNCGAPADAFGYCCSCNNKAWTRRYRTFDIEIDAYAKRKAIFSSFNNYSFSDEAGMLQYKLLPNHSKKIDETIGLTPLHYLSNFSHRNNFIFLKDEGQNPSGCFKDRESMMCKLNFEIGDAEHAVIYSSGNAAASAALILEHSDAHLITFVPGDTYPAKIEYIRKHGSDVVIIGNKNTSFEEGYRLFADINAAGIFEDFGFDNWSVNNPYRVQGDKTMAVEIIKQLSPGTDITTVPDFVIVPTANGSCLAGIWKGFKELYEAKVIEKLPKMVSAGIKNASPVCRAIKKNETDKPVRCDLSKVDEEDADVGSIILAEEGYDSVQAATAVKESHGTAVEVHASDIKKTLIHFLEEESDQALKHAILPEPASLTSLAAIKKFPNTGSSSSSKITVAISTGHGSKARNKIESLLKDRPKLQILAKIIASKRLETMKTAQTKTGTKISALTSLASVFDAFFNLQKNYESEPVIQSV